MIRSRNLLPALIALFSVLVLAAGTGIADASSPPSLSAFEGDWSQLNRTGDERTRLVAIDEAVNGLSWVVRKMAAPVLRRTTAPPPRIQFVWDGLQLEQHVRGETVRRVDLGAPAEDSSDSRGEPMTASWQWSESGLRLSWSQEQAHGHNLYRLDPDSETLVVQHTIQVTAISDVEPIVFESHFRRGALPPVASGAPSDTLPTPTN